MAKPEAQPCPSHADRRDALLPGVSLKPTLAVPWPTPT